MDNLSKDKDMNSYPKGSNLLYLGIVGIVFLVFTVIFIAFPRTTYSELEKRDLASFPDISGLHENPSQFTQDISHWFSDSEPFRDEFMTASMMIRDAFRLNLNKPEEAVSFRPMEGPGGGIVEGNEGEEILSPQGNPLANENAKVQNSGIIVVGTAPNARAFMSFGGTENSAALYTATVNQYCKAFPDQKVYALISSSATEFYLPDKAKSASKSEMPVLNGIKAGLDERVIFIDARSALAAHTKEDIFLRTDHHWAPLGAFYAAEAFAKKAGLPFKQLDSYDKHVIRGYVGSMYGYSKDIAIKNSPEDFVYWTPRNIDYKTDFITYKTDKDFKIISENGPYPGEYFKKFNDGSGSAYLTFMGGDQHIAHVKTNAGTNRKLLVIKDSYGNAIPGYLFYSFDDIHIVDFRYFTKNIKDYVKKQGVTDILITFNIFNACNGASMQKVQKFLTQENANSFKISGTEEEKKNKVVSSEEIKATENIEKSENNSSTEVTTEIQIPSGENNEPS